MTLVITVARGLDFRSTRIPRRVGCAFKTIRRDLPNRWVAGTTTKTVMRVENGTSTVHLRIVYFIHNIYYQHMYDKRFPIIHDGRDKQKTGS